MELKKSTIVKIDPIYQIVSTYPEVLQYRNSIKDSETGDKSLMLVGGSVTERDACVDYISQLPFSGVDIFSCQVKSKKNSNSKNIGFSANLNFANTIIETIGKNNYNSDGLLCNSRLLVLKCISRTDNKSLYNLAREFAISNNKPNYFVATIGCKDELDYLPGEWRGLFDEIHLTIQNEKPKKKLNFVPKEEVDKLLKVYVEKYPYESRRFIAEKALKEIVKVFAGMACYKKSTLMTQISLIRNKKHDQISDRKFTHKLRLPEVAHNKMDSSANYASLLI